MQVLIADDNIAMRAWLSAAVHSKFPELSVLEADSVKGALALCHHQPPHIVLAGLLLADGGAVEIAATLRRRFPPLAAIVIGPPGSAAFAGWALSNGACAYITRDDLPRKLVPALTRAVRLAGHVSETSDGKRAAKAPWRHA